jgi:hypothetical protein
MLRSFLLFFAFPLALALAACDCGTTPPPPKVECNANQIECIIAGETTCVPFNPDGLCQPWQQCAEGSGVCDADGNVSCTCVTKPPLNPGTQVAYTASAQLANGALIIAGWNPGFISSPTSGPYKDLNVGWWNPAGVHTVCDEGAVVWETVKGIPTGVTPTADPAGPRGGIVATGEEVGRYTGIVAIGDDVLVTYENATEKTLEAAYGTFTGTGPNDVSFDWSFHTIDPDGGAMVLWTDVTLGNGGNPVVVYTVASRPDVANGVSQPQFSQRVATATVASPASIDDWQIETLAEGDARCSPQLPCGEGYFCARAGFHGYCALVAPDGSCNSMSTGTSTCAAGGGLLGGAETCVAAAGLPPAFCDTSAHANYCCMSPQNAFDYPPVDGLYNDVERTTTGLALVYYARVSGELRLRVMTDGVGWGAPVCLAGCSPSADAGPGASLFVDGTNTLHIAYVDAIAGDIRYMRTSLVGVLAEDVLVDEGTITSLPDREGPGFVGDDSDITIVAGEVRIVYSDTANHEALLARRPGGTGPFLVEAYSSNRADGNFPTIVADATAGSGDVTLVTSTYRATGAAPIESDTCGYSIGPAAP